jgi:hypothetical protein
MDLFGSSMGLTERELNLCAPGVCLQCAPSRHMLKSSYFDELIPSTNSGHSFNNVTCLPHVSHAGPSQRPCFYYTSHILKPCRKSEPIYLQAKIKLSLYLTKYHTMKAYTSTCS